MRTKRGFTLIELLVVIAIIAVLLAILMPSLRKAKDAAKRAVCLAHLHSLGLSWVMYAGENDSLIPYAFTKRVTAVGTNPRRFQIDTPKSWVGWFVEPPDASGKPIPDKEGRMACIELGSLFPYSKAIKVYRCPVGVRDELRTYAIVDAMNGAQASGLKNDGGKWITKVSQLRSTSTRLVFIDEGWASTESWTIYPKKIKWWDRPPVRHGDGTTVAMADGSAEYWKWKDQRTTDYAKGLLTDPVATAQNNEDFIKLQRAAWGNLQ